MSNDLLAEISQDVILQTIKNCSLSALPAGGKRNTSLTNESFDVIATSPDSFGNMCEEVHFPTGDVFGYYSTLTVPACTREIDRSCSE